MEENSNPEALSVKDYLRVVLNAVWFCFFRDVQIFGIVFVYFLHENKISVSMICDGTMQKVAVSSIGIPVHTGFGVKYFWNKSTHLHKTATLCILPSCCYAVLRKLCIAV
jgi:hypothetical protein